MALFPDPVDAIEPLTPANRFTAFRFGLSEQALLYATDFVDRGVLPEAQKPHATLDIEFVMRSNDASFMRLSNHSDFAVDISGWKLGDDDFTLPGGAVVPPNGEAYIVKDDNAFRVAELEPSLVLGTYDSIEENITLELTRSDGSSVGMP